jgi:LPS O-antigen subunit length determinant protein (WzzB/FepE family)
MRISRISENLRIIQKEISLLAAEELESSLREEPFGEPDVKALRKVKSSVDHLRQVLRTYIDFASAQVDAQDPEEFQAARAERTTQILRFACQGLQLREGKNHEVPSSLFEQLMQLAFVAVDRHKLKAPAVEEELLQTAAD